MKMILDFSKANFDPKQYFISSDLLEDSGIECPNESITHLCMLVDEPDVFVNTLKSFSLDSLIKVYDFFDQYCISKGIIKIIDIVMIEAVNGPYIPPCTIIECIDRFKNRLDLVFPRLDQIKKDETLKETFLYYGDEDAHNYDHNITSITYDNTCICIYI
jgi:hypothetical protein